MIPIYESFENLEESKKQIIIDAGFKVFGEDGFKKASVEQIVAEAGISKGSLFYYFGSKKNYYLYLYEYCTHKMKQLIDDPGDDGLPAYLNKTDFFERLEHVQMLKRICAMKYPHMFTFMKRTITETSPEVRSEIQAYNQLITKERTTDFYYNLDHDKFKEGIDPRMVLQLLTWVSEGCANMVIMKQKQSPASEQLSYDFDEIISIYQTYVKLLRDNFYKEEYLQDSTDRTKT